MRSRSRFGRYNAVRTVMALTKALVGRRAESKVLVALREYDTY